MFEFSLEGFDTVSSEWSALETGQTSPFLHYDYLRYIIRTHHRRDSNQVKVACVRQDGNLLMLVPLLFQGNSKPVLMLGDIQGCDIADAIYAPNLDESTVSIITAFFFSQLHGPASLNRIPENSPLIDASSLNPEHILSESRVEYVRIPLGDNWETHLQRLSKSVRQNIRTAYNRMNRDGISWHLEVYDDRNPLNDAVWNGIMNTYFDRLLAKYRRGVFSDETKGGIIIQSLKYVYFRYIRKYQTFHHKHDTSSLRELPNSVHAVLYHEDRIMAFFSGFYTHNRSRICVPRLAFNEAYKFYSPGYVLLSETLQRLYAEGSVTVLDLCRGDERYKYDLGGESYFTKNIFLHLP